MESGTIREAISNKINLPSMIVSPPRLTLPHFSRDRNLIASYIEKPREYEKRRGREKNGQLINLIEDIL